MVWVLERLPEDIPKYASSRSIWETMEEGAYFLSQRRVHQAATRSKGESTCPFCAELKSLGGGKCVLCGEMEFRIIYRHSSIRLVVAKASSEEESKQLMKELKVNIQPMLRILEQDSVSNQVQPKEPKSNRMKQLFSPRPKSPRKSSSPRKCMSSPRGTKEQETGNELIDFVKLKVASMIKDDDQFQTKFTFISIEENFKSFFPAVGMNEETEILEECSLWESQYHSGMFRVTKNYFFFVEAKGDRKFWLPWSSIDDMRRIKTETFDRISFFSQKIANFSVVEVNSVEDTFTKCKKIWRTAVQINLKSQDKGKHRRNGSVDAFSPAKRNSIFREVGSADSVGGSASLPHIPLQIDEDVGSTMEYLKPLFSNPALESLIRTPGTLFRSHKKAAKTRQGILEVSYHSLHFSSLDNAYVVTLPFIDVQRIAKKPPNTTKIVLKAEGAKNIYIILEQGNVAAMISRLHNASIGEEESSQFLTVRPHDPLWKEKQAYLRSYFDPQAEKALLGHWKNYFDYFGSGSTMIRTRSLFDLILNGIPNSLRPMMWQVSSGSYYNRINEAVSYQHYLEKSKECENAEDSDERIKEHQEYVAEIGRDINRSFPGHPYYKRDGPGVQSLNNILTAFSWRNPVIGYCQGMNIITAVILLFMPEQEAFFLLCTIVEDLFPEYYSKSMVGSLVDLQVIDELVCQHLPDVHMHVLEAVGGVALVTVPWFMCLFIHCLPWDATLRAIDLILAEGSRALFVVALATFHACRKEILEAQGDDLLDFLKNDLKETVNTLTLLQSIKHFDPLITGALVTELRVKYKPDIVGEIREEINSTENDTDTDDDTSSNVDENSEGKESAVIDLPQPDPIPDEDREANMKKFEQMIQENQNEYRKVRYEALKLNLPVAEDFEMDNVILTARGRSRTSRIDPDISKFRKKVRPSLFDFKECGFSTTMAVLPPVTKSVLQQEPRNLALSHPETVKIRSKSKKRRSAKRKSGSIMGMKAFMSVRLPEEQARHVVFDGYESPGEDEEEPGHFVAARRKRIPSFNSPRRLSIDVSVVHQIQKELAPFDED